MNIRRLGSNALKMVGVAITTLIAACLLTLGGFWPLLLWHTFDAPLSVAVAILLVWWMSLL